MEGCVMASVPVSEFLVIKVELGKIWEEMNPENCGTEEGKRIVRMERLKRRMHEEMMCGNI